MSWKRTANDDVTEDIWGTTKTNQEVPDTIDSFSTQVINDDIEEKAPEHVRENF